jgi:predicted SAM-dependent methyltransferase
MRYKLIRIRDKLINGVFKRSAPAGDHESTKLHIGCGTNIMKGWVNIDSDKALIPDMTLDVTEGLPFKDNSVSFIFSEDFIEHVTLERAEKFLETCYRILKPGGVMRIVTPDLQTIVRTYVDRQEEALDWFRKTFGCRTHGEMLNTAMTMGGHSFMFDKETLMLILEKSGFSVKEQSFQKSDIKELINLDLRGEGVHLYFDCYK